LFPGFSALCLRAVSVFFFFQAEDGIRDFHVTGVQTCALPILNARLGGTVRLEAGASLGRFEGTTENERRLARLGLEVRPVTWAQIGRASCRERAERSGGAVSLKEESDADNRSAHTPGTEQDGP